MNTLAKRKRLRLEGYDYSQSGIYFVTVCTHNRSEYFGKVIPALDQFTTASIELTEIGFIVEKEIDILDNYHETISVEAYVIMPNHVHMLISINGRNAPNISRLMQMWKRAITKKIGQSIWQKSFHDHVVRSPEDYARLLEYIENNPAQWELDSLNPNA